MACKLGCGVKVKESMVQAEAQCARNLDAGRSKAGLGPQEGQCGPSAGNPGKCHAVRLAGDR